MKLNVIFMFSMAFLSLNLAEVNIMVKNEVNGCGPSNSFLHGITQKILKGCDLLDSFNPCCISHDLCYRSCNRDKKSCDKEFFDCMQTKCKGDSKSRPKCKCQPSAWTAYSAVSLFGKQFYEKDQKNSGCKRYF